MSDRRALIDRRTRNRVVHAGSWAWRARRLITELAVIDYPHLDGKDLMKAIDQHYPWGARDMLPFKAWRRELRLACGMMKAPRRKPSPQLDL